MDVLLYCYYAVFRYSFGLYCVQICFVVVCTSRIILGDFKAISARFLFFSGILWCFGVLCECACNTRVYVCVLKVGNLFTRVRDSWFLVSCVCMKGIFYRVCVIVNTYYVCV